MRRERIGHNDAPAAGHASRRRRHPDPEVHPARRGDHGECTRLDDASHSRPRCAWIERSGCACRGMLDRRRLPEPCPEASIAPSFEHDSTSIAHDQRLPVHRWPCSLRRDGWNAIDRPSTKGGASRSPRARLATGRPWCAGEGAKFHQSLVECRRRGCTIHQILRGRPQPLLRGAIRRILRTTMHPEQHPRHVPVDDGSAFAMHDAGDRTSGVPTDSGQGDELGGALWDRAVEPGHARLRRFMQSPGSAVVAKPLPHREHVVFRRSRERWRRGPTRDERLEPLDHATHLRLLQHALANEGSITAPLTPPRKVARVFGEPPFDRCHEPLCRG